MMDGTFVKEFAGAVHRAAVLRVGGFEILTRPEADGAVTVDAELSAELSSPDALEVAGLAGLVDYMDADRDRLELSRCVVHVEDHRNVSLRGPLSGRFRIRPRYVRAGCVVDGFKFNTYLQHEDFVVGLLSQFRETPIRGQVLELIGKVTDGNVVTAEDDGLAQSVTARRGATLVSRATVPNPVNLAPFRTFPELEQPTSPFVLRLRAGDPLPTVGLFEADGGRWKLDAIASAKAWLGERLAPLGVPVIG